MIERGSTRPLIIALLAVGAAALVGQWAAGYDRSADISGLTDAGRRPTTAAARSLRSGDCEQAARLLSSGAQPDDGAAYEHRVLSGLYAYACGRYSTSLELLRAADSYSGPLADWRLLSLAASAARLGQIEVARATLGRLVREHPDSPLLLPSVVRAVELAVESNDHLQARALIEDARSRQLAPEHDERLETAAWRIAAALADREWERSAARNLLVRHPLKAAELAVIEVFRQPSGELFWTEFLSTAQLLERARSLLEAELPAQAVSLLEDAAPPARDLEWSLLMAEALTADARGAEALTLLAGLGSQAPDELVRIEWQRARSALEASRARRGRTLASAERRRMRELSHEHLRRLLGLGPERELAIRALRILFSDLAEAERFEESLEILRALRDLDPSDTTGARYLWRLGWEEFNDRNYSSAVGYWTELGQLYPYSSYARAGLYWSARSHHALGNHERAEEMLRRVAEGDFPDFYRQHALRQVDPSTEPPARLETRQTAWPSDPLLARAALLTDLGLDDAALEELTLLSSAVDPVAASALRSQILANQGRVRDSIIALRRAFPELGTPAETRAPERARRLYYPLEYSDIIETHAEHQALPASLVFGMIRQESAFDAGARSWAGARGLMQVMPATGRELARRMGLHYSRERLSDPGFSVLLGTAYFRQVLKMFDGNEQLALAGYNAGPYRIKRLWRQAGPRPELDRFLEDLPMEETRTYVKRVMLFSGRYRDLYGAEI